MSSNTSISIYQACTDPWSTIGISNIPNYIGILVGILAAAVAVVAQIAIFKRQTSCEQKDNITSDNDTPKTNNNNNNQSGNTDNNSEKSEYNLHYDETSFKQPKPPKEECPICMQRMPSLMSGNIYLSCCGKMICCGCTFTPVYDNQGNKVAKKVCPFCRTPLFTSDEEYIEMLNNRVEAGDALAIYSRGCDYRDGRNGLPQDFTKVLEQVYRAAELDYAGAYTAIGNVYYDGRGVEVDKKKAEHYYELGAVRGCITARHNLGLIEFRCGNTNRALKHYMIAIKDGHNDSLEETKRLFKEGHGTKDDYAKALRSYQSYLKEIKSGQRDKAAAATKGNRYH